MSFIVQLLDDKIDAGSTLTWVVGLNNQKRSGSVYAASGDGLVGVGFKPTLVCIVQPNDTKQVLGIVELVGFLAL